MSINARIRKRTGRRGFTSYQFSVVENFRRKDETGKPSHRVILYLGTLSQSKAKLPLEQLFFLRSAELAVDGLVLQNKISVLDAEKVKDKFQEALWHPFPITRSASKPIAKFSKVKNDVLKKFNL